MSLAATLVQPLLGAIEEEVMRPNIWTLALSCGLIVGCGKSATPNPNTTATPANQQVPTTTASQSSSTASATGDSAANSPDGSRDNATQAGASIAEQDATKAPADARPLTDKEIAGVTEAANSSEIEQAKIAEKRAKNPEVRRFAGMMLTHHQKAQAELTKLGIKTADSPVSIQLDTANASTVDLLKNSTGDFDRVYIDSQVEAHRNVIALIDAQLLPNAKEPSLRAYLQKIRSQVEEHLRQAEVQQQTLSASARAGHSSPGASKSKTVASSDTSAR